MPFYGGETEAQALQPRSGRVRTEGNPSGRSPRLRALPSQRMHSHPKLCRESKLHSDKLRITTMPHVSQWTTSTARCRTRKASDKLPRTYMAHPGKEKLQGAQHPSRDAARLVKTSGCSLYSVPYLEGSKLLNQYVFSCEKRGNSLQVI